MGYGYEECGSISSLASSGKSVPGMSDGGRGGNCRSEVEVLVGRVKGRVRQRK
jgi:hypothetical protein